MTANPQTCPQCGSPVVPGMKFCESCGTKVEALPACPQCGAGQFGVSQIQVTLTRSDGSSETKSFKPDTVGSGITIQGTPKTDRVEATAYFFNGEQYKIMDQIFEYKKRGG